MTDEECVLRLLSESDPRVVRIRYIRAVSFWEPNGRIVLLSTMESIAAFLADPRRFASAQMLQIHFNPELLGYEIRGECEYIKQRASVLLAQTPRR